MYMYVVLRIIDRCKMVCVRVVGSRSDAVDDVFTMCGARFRVSKSVCVSISKVKHVRVKEILNSFFRGSRLRFDFEGKTCQIKRDK